MDDGRRKGMCMLYMQGYLGNLFYGYYDEVRKEEGYVSLNKREGDGERVTFGVYVTGWGCTGEK